MMAYLFANPHGLWLTLGGLLLAAELLGCPVERLRRPTGRPVALAVAVWVGDATLPVCAIDGDQRPTLVALATT